MHGRGLEIISHGIHITETLRSYANEIYLDLTELV